MHNLVVVVQFGENYFHGESDTQRISAFCLREIMILTLTEDSCGGCKNLLHVLFHIDSVEDILDEKWFFCYPGLEERK